MEKYLIEDTTLTAIGNAVRAKTGTSGMLSVEAMAEALGNIKDSGKYLFSKKETVDGDILGYAVTDNLAKYPDGGWQNGYYWELASKISFKIGQVTYYAAEGMTWAEWVETDYNTGGWYIDTIGDVRASSGLVSNVTSTQTIVDGQTYTAVVSGGSNN